MRDRIICLVTLSLFTIYPFIRLYPLENMLSSELIGIDDWNKYARFALDIKQNGLSISSVQGNYYAPAGFLYNYFLAFCFYLFGENTVPVYFFQNILLGVSTLLFYFTFSEKMKKTTSMIFLFCLIVFAFADMGKYYCFQFMSENLAVLLISIFLFCTIKVSEKGRTGFIFPAAFSLGCLVLTRPNILPFALLFIIILVLNRNKILKTNAIIISVLLFFVVISSLAIRNYIVAGNLFFLPTEGVSFAQGSLSRLNIFVLGKKLLFCLGILSPLDASLHWRPHWMIAWLIYFIYLFLKIKSEVKFGWGETIVHLFILFYYGSLVLVAPVLNSYGFRLVAPGVYVILPFVFLCADTFTNKKKSPFLH